MRFLLILGLAGCASITSGANAPISPLDRFGMYRHAVEYELMPRVRGEACASAAVEDSQYKRTRDPSKIVNGFLYEKAKGRPYHITAMRAVPGPERPTDPIAHKPETPLGEVIEPTFQGQ
jgi:hypothetical protein